MKTRHCDVQISDMTVDLVIVWVQTLLLSGWISLYFFFIFILHLSSSSSFKFYVSSVPSVLYQKLLMTMKPSK